MDKNMPEGIEPLEDYAAEARIFKALSNEYRLQALSRLRTGEKCACDLLDHIKISQSNLSHHMKILCDSGIVTAREQGKWTYYALSPEGSHAAIELLEHLTTVSDIVEAPACCDDDQCCCSSKSSHIPDKRK